ncbi:MAG: hypothetical protein KGN33_08215 [Paracoccaceae bacterium]|nr:hypothetical protein [Paracoccaceae bacterium]
MSQALHIDTLKFARKLAAAGVDPKAADAIAEGIGEIDTTELATKSDLAHLEQSLTMKMDRLTMRIGGMIALAVIVLGAARHYLH